MTDIFNFITMLAGIITGGSFLFYRQNKISKKIDNESRQSEEWRKLYDNSRVVEKEKEEEIKQLDEKITTLSDKLQITSARVFKLEQDSEIDKRYSCSLIDCEKRVPKK